MEENNRRRVLVVGGGVFGLPAARELARRGWAVTVVDPGPPHPDASSTDISKAVRSDYGSDLFHVELAERAIEGWHRWNDEAGRLLFRADGFLLLTSEPMEGGYEGDGYRLLRKRGAALERYDAARIRRELPSWRADRFVDGYLNPAGGWADATATMEWCVHQALAAGVELRRGRIAGLLESGERVVGVRLQNGSTLEASVVLVAAGAWTPALLPWLGSAMWPSGQPVLHFAPERPERFAGPVWGADITRTGWYGFPPTVEGIVKVGHHGEGYRVAAAGGVPVDPGHEGRCREFLREALPPLADAPRVGSRVCFYCDTWDGDFWIDHDPDRPGLVVATGGSGHGFKFVTVLGDIVADVVERRSNPWAARFAWRKPGARRVESSRSLS